MVVEVKRPELDAKPRYQSIAESSSSSVSLSSRYAQGCSVRSWLALWWPVSSALVSLNGAEMGRRECGTVRVVYQNNLFVLHWLWYCNGRTTMGAVGNKVDLLAVDAWTANHLIQFALRSPPSRNEEGPRLPSVYCIVRYSAVP